MPVNVPVPVAFATVTEPLPAVTLGPEWKITRTPAPSAVAPSVVAIGWGMRFCTVSSNEKIPVPPL